MKGYETIYVRYPIWWGTATWSVNCFVEETL